MNGFCLKQGQDLKALAAHLHPNSPQVTPPPRVYIAQHPTLNWIITELCLRLNIARFKIRLFVCFHFSVDRSRVLQILTCNLQPATCNLRPATCNLQPATCKLTQTRQLGVRYALIVFVLFRLNTIALVLSVSCPKFHQSVLAVLDFSLPWNPNFPSNLKLAYGN